MRRRWSVLLIVVVVSITFMFRPSNDEVLIFSLVEGEVMVASEQGPDRQASVGDTLKLQDRVTTGVFGRTTITIGSGSTVTLPSNSQVRLTDISKQSVRVELDSGALSAVIRPESGVLTLASAGRQLVSSDASLRMQLFDDGLTVDVIEGSVETRGLAGLTSLEAGKRAMALNGEEGVVSRRAGEMLLAVTWPDDRRTRAGEVSVQGTTEPGAWVSVTGGGSPVKTRANGAGEFTLSVILTEGENALALESIDAFGENRVLSWQIERDSTAPRFRGGIE